MDEVVESRKWFEDYADDVEPEGSIGEYELTSSPSDFNTLTLYDFIEKGALFIPEFQRNYVWDIKKASKLEVVPISGGDS